MTLLTDNWSCSLLKDSEVSWMTLLHVRGILLTDHCLQYSILLYDHWSCCMLDEVLTNNLSIMKEPAGRFWSLLLHAGWFFWLTIDLVACWRTLKSTDDPAACWMTLLTDSWSSSLLEDPKVYWWSWCMLDVSSNWHFSRSLLENLQVYWVILLALLHVWCFAWLKKWTRRLQFNPKYVGCYSWLQLEKPEVDSTILLHAGWTSIWMWSKAAEGWQEKVAAWWRS
jgi:hypothetical protein